MVDHLVGIHVDRRSGSTLHHVDGEMVVELAVDNLAASLRDGSCDFVVDDAECVVGLHGSQFHVCDGDDEVVVVAHLLA